MRRLVMCLSVLGALVAPAAANASSSMFMCAVEIARLVDDPIEAKAKVDLARLAGFDTLRVSMFWKRGNGSVIPAPDLVRLHNAAQAAQLDGMRLIVSVSNFNSADTLLTYLSQLDFAVYCVAVS